MIFTGGKSPKPAAVAVNKLVYVCNKNNIISICDTAAAAAVNKLPYLCNKNNITSIFETAAAAVGNN